jgi:hypothetical protein
MQIHLIAFDIPFPADYGGAIDVFYKLKALHKLGFRVILHCFQYGNRLPSKELEQFSEKSFYYKRPISIKSFFAFTPFIVQTRNDKALLDNLLLDNAPIFFEGTHSTFWINHPLLKNRKKYVRMHNIESQYYKHLARLESNFLKKIFFWIESYKLEKYEKQLFAFDCLLFLAISKNDFKKIKKNTRNKVELLPPFHPFAKVEILEGKGNYVLFHGNLSISDNEQSAIFLIEKVFSIFNIPFVIAGKSPSKKIKQIAAQFPNISIVENPSEIYLKQLIQEAHINLLWSMQAEGIKLKLFYALFQGRFVVSNDNIVLNTGFEKLTTITNTADEIIIIIRNLFLQNFDNQQINLRITGLESAVIKQNEFLKEIFYKN